MNILKKLGLLSILSITCCFSVLEATKITSTLSQEDENTLYNMIKDKKEDDAINFISSKNLNPNYEFKFDELRKGKKLIYLGIFRPKLLKYLIEKVADKNIIWKDELNYYDGNLLHHTINQNADRYKLPEALDCIKILVESKVDIDTKNLDGDSPLALAVRRYYNFSFHKLNDYDRNIMFDIIKYLIDNGANIDTEGPAPFFTTDHDRKKLSDHIINGKKVFLGSTNKDKDKEFDKKIIDLFKQLKEKNGITSSQEDEGILIKLLTTRNTENDNDIINFISSKNLNPNYEFKFDELKKGEKLIFLGISRPKLLKYLIEKVADKNIIWKDKAYNYDGNLLHHTINQNANNNKLPVALDCIKILVESKVDIDTKNSDGDSPLALAVQRYYNYSKTELNDYNRNIMFDIIKYLIDNGANIDIEVTPPFITNISDTKKLSDHIINGKKFLLGSTNKEFDKKIIDLFKQLKEKNGITFKDLEDGKKITKDELEKTIKNFASTYKPMPSGIIAMKNTIPSGSEVAIHADFHGDKYSMFGYLNDLVKKGYLDKNNPFKIVKPNFYIIFTGDFIDRGEDGLETIYCAMRLRIENPTKVSILKGNHETIDISFRYGFINELEKKLNIDHNDSVKLIEPLYNALPITIFLGTKNNNNLTNYIMLTHAGIEPLFNPKKLLSDEKENTYENITELNLNWIENKELKSSIENSISTNEVPNIDSLGSIWSDFLINKNVPIQPGARDINVADFGEKATKQYLELLNEPNKYKVNAIIRGHQHAGEMLKNMIKNHGLYGLWIEENKQWDGKQEFINIPQNSVWTLLVSPNTLYGKNHKYSFDTYVILKTDKDFNNWKLYPVNIINKKK